MQGVQIRAGCVVGVQIWAWWNLDFEIQLDLAGEEGQSPHKTIYPRDLNQGILHISCKFRDPSLKRWSYHTNKLDDTWMDGQTHTQTDASNILFSRNF